LDSLEQGLVARHELLVRRKLGFYILFGLLVFFGFSLFSDIPLAITLAVCGFYVFGSVAVQARSKVLLLVFALAHLYPFYMLGRSTYYLFTFAATSMGVVSWWFVAGLGLALFANIGSCLGALRYAALLKMIGH